MSSTKRSLSFILFISLFAFTSCKKSSDDSGVNIPESTMSFKLNGTVKTFSNAVAVSTVQDSINVIAITGLAGSDASKTLTVMIGSKGQIGSGFSIDQTAIDGNEVSIGIVNFLEDSKGYSSVAISDSAVTQFNIHVTEKTSTHVKGTFTAKLFSEEEDSQTATYVVTEGKFNARIQAQ
jgi:hypothetical protein